MCRINTSTLANEEEFRWKHGNALKENKQLRMAAMNGNQTLSLFSKRGIIDETKAT
jgi:hypothetical protein